MKTTFSAIVVAFAVVVSGLWPVPASALPTAHCWCNVTCAIPTAGTYNTGDVAVGSGINWPYTTAKWNQCDTDCTNYVNNSLDVNAIDAQAQQHNYCGPVSCTSVHHIGTRDTRGGASRTVNMTCPTNPSGQETGPSQYAVKFMCGTSTNAKPVDPGTYSTVINVHNPNEDATPFRWKIALATGNTDGPISGFTQASIGPDAAQRFECPLDPKTSGLIDGFFVIQANEPLDVTAYYTGGQPQVTAMAVKPVARRVIPKVDLLCTSNFAVDLSKANSWAMSNGNAPYTVTTVGAWAPGRTWMSYASNGYSGTNMSTTFGMNFCSCSGKGGSINGDVRSDNGSAGALLAPSPASQSMFSITGNGNYNSGAAATFTNNFTGAGNGSVAVTLANLGGPSGVSFTGQLTLDSGYMGMCKIP